LAATPWASAHHRNGAAIGAGVNGGVGAGVGAAAGLVVGIAGVMFTRGHDTYVGSEQLLVFRIKEPLMIATTTAPKRSCR